MIYLTWAAFYGKVAGNNPWPATGLEWTTQSPPLTENFEVTPMVTWEAYDFHNRPELGLDVPGHTGSPTVAAGSWGRLTYSRVHARDTGAHWVPDLDG